MTRDEAQRSIQPFYEAVTYGNFMNSYIQVTTTTETREEAQKIARCLVEQKLAACAQIAGPITSTYRWKGKVETAEEWLCLIKTQESLYSELEKTIIGLHSYETPEIIAVPIIKGSREYLSWLKNETEKLDLKVEA
ncbi:MAG: divalent-cation tolerance protein CutA [Smithella sp.]